MDGRRVGAKPNNSGRIIRLRNGLPRHGVSLKKKKEGGGGRKEPKRCIQKGWTG